MYFTYGEREIAHLKKCDVKLGAAIDRIGYVQREVNTDIFSSVIHHIIGQQISTAAQNTVWKRFKNALQHSSDVDALCAKNVLACSREALQECGMTFRKVDYICDFAQKVHDGHFDVTALHTMSDQEVISALSALKGIGVWTAEMLLLFCLQRQNVLSFGDLAIHRGMRMLYHHENIDKKRFAIYARRYAPYGSVASLYLWAIAGGAIPELRDYAPAKPKKN